MCNCSKSISQTDCQRLLDCILDPEKRFFIYHIFSDSDGKNRLEIACVKKNEDPNEKAKQLGYVDSKGVPEWYNVNEHPCLYGNKT